MRLFVSLFFFVWSLSAMSQNIAGFTDYQKFFWVFDEGKFRQLEFQPVLDFQVGDQCVGYVTNANHFKVYYQHIPHHLTNMVSDYQVTDNLVAYTVGTQLYVFEGGNKYLLSKFVGHYAASDSMVAYFDTEKYFFRVYYKGKIRTLEDGLLFSDVNSFRVGNNMMAYIDAFQNFKAYYQGETYELLNTDQVVDVQIGRNILAFVEPVAGTLHAFYEGEDIELESFKPKSFSAGYEKIAYVDNMGNFKLFDDGELYMVSDFEPDEYTLKDDILVYHLNGFLYAFSGGENYLIENYIPDSYQINDNAIAYIDQDNNLQLVTKGQLETLSYEKVNSYAVYRNLVIYHQGVNTVKVFYEGEVYENR